jgi:hypothetical protein
MLEQKKGTGVRVLYLEGKEVKAAKASENCVEV